MSELQAMATGRRKESVARVRLIPGSGQITINGKDLDKYFGLETLKLIYASRWWLLKLSTAMMSLPGCTEAAFPGRLEPFATALPARWFSLNPNIVPCLSEAATSPATPG